MRESAFGAEEGGGTVWVCRARVAAARSVAVGRMKR